MRDHVGARAEVGDDQPARDATGRPARRQLRPGRRRRTPDGHHQQGQEDDTLTDISGDGFGDYEIDDDPPDPPAGPSRPRSTSPPATVFADGENLTITLTDLDESLTTGQTLDVTFTFENAGEVTVPVTVSTPEDDLPRGESFDFHPEEESVSG